MGRLRAVIIILLSSLLFSSCGELSGVAGPYAASVNKDTSLSVSSITNLKEEVRGSWIASVYNINFPSSPDLSEESLKSQIDSIVLTAKQIGLNTLFFQVHPCSDSLYKSELFPVSTYLSSKRELYFDPLSYMIDSCRSAGISLYAWLNPLRVTVKSFDTEEDAIASLIYTIITIFIVYIFKDKLKNILKFLF